MALSPAGSAWYRCSLTGPHSLSAQRRPTNIFR